LTEVPPRDAFEAQASLKMVLEGLELDVIARRPSAAIGAKVPLLAAVPAAVRYSHNGGPAL
jgi:hypothetical protein